MQHRKGAVKRAANNNNRFKDVMFVLSNEYEYNCNGAGCYAEANLDTTFLDSRFL
jgi:hypothetical protein